MQVEPVARHGHNSPGMQSRGRVSAAHPVRIGVPKPEEFALRRIHLLTTFALIALAFPAAAQTESAPQDSDPAEAATNIARTEAPSAELTLEEMVIQGGPILWIIVGLSVLTLMLVLYFFLTVTPRREVPVKFVRRAHAQLVDDDIKGAAQMCEDRDELIANVLRAGIRMHGHDRYVIQEAMESEGERGATALWQKISYLNNIGVIAPLLGLLGTVWGMIGAFSSIVSSDTESRGLLMAANVSQAMVTTAAGLMLAIPAMAAYFYFRGRVVKIIAIVEAEAAEMVDLLVNQPRSG
jgi:biopolymer transport protein ExbB